MGTDFCTMTRVDSRTSALYGSAGTGTSTRLKRNTAGSGVSMVRPRGAVPGAIENGPTERWPSPVEGTSLLRRRTRFCGAGGSNPPLSALSAVEHSLQQDEPMISDDAVDEAIANASEASEEDIQAFYEQQCERASVSGSNDTLEVLGAFWLMWEDGGRSSEFEFRCEHETPSYVHVA